MAQINPIEERVRNSLTQRLNEGVHAITSFEDLHKEEQAFALLLVEFGYANLIETRIQDTVVSLLEKPFLIDPVAKKLLDELVVELRNRFPDYEPTILIVGSKATGGSIFRRLLLGFNNEDYDLVLLYSGLESTALQHQVYDFVTEYIQKQNHVVCDTINVWNYAYPNLKNVDEAQTLLLRFSELDFESWDMVWNESQTPPFILYCLPSFPRETNQRNLALLLEAWQKLVSPPPKSDTETEPTPLPEYLQSIRDKIRMTWQSVRFIEPKHLLEPNQSEYSDDYEKMEKVSRDTKWVLFQKLMGLFDEVAKNPDANIAQMVQDFMRLPGDVVPNTKE